MTKRSIGEGMTWIAGIALVVISAGAQAHGGHGGSAQLQRHNNDRAIAAQVCGGLHRDTGEVTIRFHGNIAFEIVSPRGAKIFIDPWRNDITGMYPPWYTRDMPIASLSRLDTNVYPSLSKKRRATELLRASRSFTAQAAVLDTILRVPACRRLRE